jgi:hypothetical protein
MSSLSASVALHESANVVLNGSGAGIAKVGPTSGREAWSPAKVHVSAATNVNEAECSVFVGVDTGPNGFRDITFSGSSGDTTDAVENDTVKCGTYILASWTGGDAGSVATMVVTGSKTI